MRSLLAATLLWAFSFGLIKRHLGGLDPNFVAAMRLVLALPLFLPLLRARGLGAGLVARLLAIGAVQYGLMYVGYITAFQFAAAHEVVLYTVLTPLYVALICDAYARRFDPVNVALAAMAAAGAAVIQHREGAGVAWLGFLLVQLSSVCFAWGQSAYRRLRRERTDLRDREVIALLYLGGVAVTVIATSLSGGWATLTKVSSTQWLVFAYLGVLATGLGFYLWNRGAVQVGAGALAVANNLKVPLGVLVALTVFGEQADLLRLGIGGGLMVLAAALAARRGEA
ncbi:EamA family transporter [Nannocystis pusilla]|uniref:EamA family transporter n=1 Tax=Nannocystis pusilla TaxID=889268 RepID=UPI003B7FEDBA